jgi:type II secretory pathway pseudopilin PulG
VEATSETSRRFYFRLRTLLVAIGLAGLLLALVAHELRLRSELQRERDRAEANSRLARAAVDQFYTQVAAQSVAKEPQGDQIRREVLERALKFYEGMPAAASSPAQKAKALDRIQRIRTELDFKDQSTKGKS